MKRFTVLMVVALVATACGSSAALESTFPPVESTVGDTTTAAAPTTTAGPTTTEGVGFP